MVTTEPHAVRIGEGGGVLRGQVDLTGLPPGEYTFTVRVQLGDTTLQRSAGLTVEGFDTTLAAEAVASAPEAGSLAVSDVDYFAKMTTGQLDTAFAPLIYLAEASELKAYDKRLTQAAKAKFLATFWTSRDPSPGTADNPVRDAFYARIDDANKLYRESGRSSTPGWRTDRGRIFLRNGKPDDVWRREKEGYTPPLEVWKYTRGRSRYYIFGDRSNFGNWRMLHSDDLKEPGAPDWEEQLGYYGLEAVGQYLGINLVDAAASRQ
jgi:GWxTD domain-containing protein